jgi:hypothetical protein
LSAHVVNLNDLSANVAKKLPRYPSVRATLLVSQNLRGRGIGELLLLDEFNRVLVNTREIASAVSGSTQRMSGRAHFPSITILFHFYRSRTGCSIRSRPLRNYFLGWKFGRLVEMTISQVKSGRGAPAHFAGERPPSYRRLRHVPPYAAVVRRYLPFTVWRPVAG